MKIVFNIAALSFFIHECNSVKVADLKLAQVSIGQILCHESHVNFTLVACQTLTNAELSFADPSAAFSGDAIQKKVDGIIDKLFSAQVNNMSTSSANAQPATTTPTKEGVKQAEPAQPEKTEQTEQTEEEKQQVALKGVNKFANGIIAMIMLCALIAFCVGKTKACCGLCATSILCCFVQ